VRCSNTGLMHAGVPCTRIRRTTSCMSLRLPARPTSLQWSSDIRYATDCSPARLRIAPCTDMLPYESILVLTCASMSPFKLRLPLRDSDRDVNVFRTLSCARCRRRSQPQSRLWRAALKRRPPSLPAPAAHRRPASAAAAWRCGRCQTCLPAHPSGIRCRVCVGRSQFALQRSGSTPACAQRWLLSCCHQPNAPACRDAMTTSFQPHPDDSLLCHAVRRRACDAHGLPRRCGSCVCASPGHGGGTRRCSGPKWPTTPSSRCFWVRRSFTIITSLC